MLAERRAVAAGHAISTGFEAQRGRYDRGNGWPVSRVHPLYIVFSSGTTGASRCIVHGAGGVLSQYIKVPRGA